MPTKTNPVLIYWDSCVFIDAIQQEPGRWATLSAILKDAEDGKIVLVASVLVCAEVAKLSKSTAPLEDQVRRIAEFFENDYIELRDVTEEIAAEAAEIVRDHNVRPMDALHLSTVLFTPCRIFHTYDGTSRNKQRTKAYLLDLNGQLGRPRLKIIEPTSQRVTLPFGK